MKDYIVKLYDCNGRECFSVIWRDFSDEDIKNIKNGIGRDVVFMGEDCAFNLKFFSSIKLEQIKEMKEDK